VNTTALARVALPRLLAGLSYDRPAGLAEHYRQYGPLPVVGRRFIDVVDASGLTGRGGAGFPAGRKMRSVAARRGGKIVVGNGCEGEPASSKDRLLLTRLPHLVLDGLVTAAAAVGAKDAYLCVHDHETGLLDSLDDAVAERNDPVRVQVAGVPARYVASEQSSIVQYLGGGPAKPTFAPPRPHERGVRGLPTLVNNVETLAHLALITRYGAGWFRGVGTPAEPGSMLVTLAGAVRDPGVHEIAIGTPVADVLALGGGAAAALSALLVGGYFGSWVDAERASKLAFSTDGLGALGAGVGAGLLAALPADACGLVETARITRYLADESAGQCGPCVFGLDAIAGQLERLADGRGPALAKLTRWIGQVGSGRGACKHPDGTIRMVVSALELFDAEVDRHLAGWCSAAGHKHGILPVPTWG
jgi:NADH:ubiquinone oxidoreductase subunit F (NADH-binding)